MKRKTIILLYLLIIFVLLNSCKIAFVNLGVKEHIKPAKLYKNILDNQFEFDNLNMKFSANVEINDNNNSFSGILRIAHDSLMWISLRSFNIEGIRAYLSFNDSVKFINRIDKTYFSGSYNYLSQYFKIDVDYIMLEAILTNNFFFYPPVEDTIQAISAFKQHNDSLHYGMSSISKRKYNKFYIDDNKTNAWWRRFDKANIGNNAKQENIINDYVFQIVKVVPEINKISEMKIENYLIQQFWTVKYDKFYKYDNQYFPNEITIYLTTQKIDVKLSLNIETIAVNNPTISYPFKIIDSYKEIIIQ